MPIWRFSQAGCCCNPWTSSARSSSTPRDSDCTSTASGPADPAGEQFFLGGGYLELSGTSRTTASENTRLWLQVRDVNAVGREFKDAGVEIIEPPTDKPWGLREMQIRDPDGLRIVIVEVPENHPLRRR